MKATPHTRKTATPVAITSEVFDDRQAGAYLGGTEPLDPRLLRLWRRKRGLPHIKLTAKVIRYRKSDLDGWLAQHRVQVGGR